MAGVKQKREKSATNSLIEFVVIIAVALGLAIGIQAFLVKPFRIPSPSMVPTLAVGQRVLVNRIGTHFGDPSRGDVVVFKPPAGANSNRCGIPSEPADGHPCGKPTADRSQDNFIKRVIGLPGDTIAVKGNHAIVNGKQLDEPYVNKPAFEPGGCSNLCNLPKPITVPKGYFFMMGDNRGESDDSRDWGPVPKEWIIGGAFFTYWPPSRIGTL
ncbi:MAG: signal peptidase [Thermoleophilaceae bacterium]|nr:signal peptidase [Thermoleophilaceae bacterium]